MVVNQITQSPNCLLGENPLWYASANLFLWTDILSGTIYSYNEKTEEIKTVLSSDFQIGAFVIDCNNDIILLTEKGLITAHYQKDLFVLDWASMIRMNMKSDERFNDAIVDCKGRIIAGTKKIDNKEGKLYCFEQNKEPKLLLDNLYISNGMGFLTSNDTFFHTDSGKKTITRYAYDPELATISNPQRIFVKQDTGTPDGMTVDASDTLWTCCWGSGELIHLDSFGTILEIITLPAVQCSSICFGSKALNKIFITSAKIGLENPATVEGKCYSMESGIKGKHEYKASPKFQSHRDTRA